MLTCDNITLYRDGKAIFKNLAFSLLPSCLLHIRGPNGSGKTSLLRLLARLINDHEGHVRYNGIDVDTASAEYFSFIRYIPSNGLLDMEFRVIDQIKLWAYLLNSADAMEAAIATLDFDGDILEQRIFSLSLGYQQRLRLLLLLLSRGAIWFLDEPFTSLDREVSDILSNMIEARRVNGGIIVYADHRDESLKDEVALVLTDFA